MLKFVCHATSATGRAYSRKESPEGVAAAWNKRPHSSLFTVHLVFVGDAIVLTCRMQTTTTGFWQGLSFFWPLFDTGYLDDRTRKTRPWPILTPAIPRSAFELTLCVSSSGVYQGGASRENKRRMMFGSKRHERGTKESGVAFSYEAPATKVTPVGARGSVWVVLSGTRREAPLRPENPDNLEKHPGVVPLGVVDTVDAERISWVGKSSLATGFQVV